MIKRITIEDNEEYLRQVSTNVDFSNDNYKKTIEKLKEYCQANVVYAMAPVQIGMPERIIYIRNTSSDMTKNSDNNYNEDIVYINPVIKKMKGNTRFLEGCESCKLSTGEFVTGVIDRPYQIEIEYYDINKEKHLKTIEGFETTIFCHEFDHLNGILHMDRTKKTYLKTLDQMREYRNKNPYKIISKEKDFTYKMN